MALQMNYYHTKLGTIVYNAYWRINPKRGLVGGKDEMNYIIEVYKNADLAHANTEPLDKSIHTFIPDMNSSVNLLAQAYNHAKTLEKYIGSVDV